MPGQTDKRELRAPLASIGAKSEWIAFARHSRERALQCWQTWASAEYALPIALVAGTAIASFLWNARAGLTFEPELPLATLSIAAFAFCAVAVLFSTVWSRPVIVELATYFGLWGIFPVFAIRLNYLAATLNFPLQDTLFARADAALGFDWRTWASIAWLHPALIDVLIFCYRSNIYQPFILVVALALRGPRGRNRELLIATVLASLLTVIVSAVLPAFGPNRAYGIASAWDPVLGALRAGRHTPLPYVGIVSFPSFHASMAVMLAASMRGYRYCFPAVVIINSFMLLATVPIGYHYFVDVIAGCAIGIGSLYLANMAARRTEAFAHRLQYEGSVER